MRIIRSFRSLRTRTLCNGLGLTGFMQISLFVILDITFTRSSDSLTLFWNSIRHFLSVV